MTTPSLYGKPLAIGDTLWVREEGWRVRSEDKDTPFTQATVESFTDSGTIRVNHEGTTYLLVTSRDEKAHFRGKRQFKVYLTKNQADYFEALDTLKQTISDRKYELQRLLADDGTVLDAVFHTAIDDFTEATAIISSED